MFHSNSTVRIPSLPDRPLCVRYDIDEVGFILYNLFDESGEVSNISDRDYDYIEAEMLKEQASVTS